MDEKVKQLEQLQIQYDRLIGLEKQINGQLKPLKSRLEETMATHNLRTLNTRDGSLKLSRVNICSSRRPNISLLYEAFENIKGAKELER